MAITKRIIHCLVDREPTAFHESGEGTKASYAINLSFEVQSNGVPADAVQDEKDAALLFKQFLQAVRSVRFHLYEVKDPDPTNIELAYVSEITERISEPDAPADLDAVYTWLDKEQKSAGLAVGYWTTRDDTQWLPDSALDVNVAGASHRLRAAQSWNAPVAHKFMLTHIVRRPVEDIKASGIVVLPFFVEHPEQPTLLGKTLGEAQFAHEAACAFDYDAKGGFGDVACYTSIVSDASPLDIKSIYPGLTADGYFEIDPEAAEVYRLLSWFEMRAASLLSSNLALATRASNPDMDDDFEERFGVRTVEVTKAGETVKVTGCSIVWYVVARLLSALDNVVIGFMNPVIVPAGAPDPKPRFDRDSQGAMLAPIVSAILDQLKDKLPPSILDADKVTSAIRSAVALTSPLVSSDPKRARPDVVRVLRQVYGIEPPKDGVPKDERELISLALACYEEARDKPVDQKPARLGVLAYAEVHKSDLVRTVSKILLDYEQPLVDEAGAEAAIIKFIETSGPSVATEVANAYLNEVKSMKPLPSGLPEDAAITAAAKTAFEQAWAAYRTLLAGPFNGAEAVRRSASGSFVRGLLDYTGLEPKNGNAALLEQTLSTSSFFAKRFAGDPAATGGCFDVHAAALVAPEADMLLLTSDADALAPDQLDNILASIRGHLRQGFLEFLEPAKAVNDPKARFIPDSTPQPLAVEIAANIDGSKIDEFSKYFNGIGLAIQRHDHGTNPDSWAHAHLADLTWPVPDETTPEDPSPDVEAAIHPMLPAINDGRGPMFMEYHGFPFADRALEARVVGNDAEARDPRRPFYAHDPHMAADKFARVPRLAYGRAFRTFSFVTSNAGTLPYDLQELNPDGNIARPWMPRPEIKEPDNSVIGKVDYQRRTAIAQMAVVEKAAGGRARIGASIDGVMPLATDYPRVGLHAESGVNGVRDLLRDPDGRGTMMATKTFEWEISDIKVSGEPSALMLYVLEGIASGPKEELPTPFAINKAKVAKLSKITVRVVFDESTPPNRSIEVKCDDGEPESHPLLPGAAFNGWLRLVLMADGDDPASMSFANIGSQKSDNISQPLLLLAPDEDKWKAGLSKPVTATVSTPRVGYLDFERWFANGNLFRDAFGKDREDKSDNPGAVFMSGLSAAYAMRKFDAKLAESLDKLPDPAVEKVRLELIVLDGLTQSTITPVEAQHHELDGRLLSVATTFAEATKGKALWKPEWLLENLLGPLDKAFRFDLTIKPGRLALEPVNKPRAMERIASVPAGMVARLSMDAVVRAGRFDKSAKGHPSVFHRGLLQYASRNVYDTATEEAPTHVIFPATALRIETMYDGMSQLDGKNDKKDRNQPAIDLAAAMIGVEGIDRTRRFDLVTEALPPDADATRHWRLLGEIDVTTQRWRNSGRPIYHHVNPRQYRFDEEPEDAAISHPALRLKFGPDGRDELAQFELEAFFDRSDVDAQTITKTLEPLPARTRLQEHYWNPESATYFRHRFKLRSRYAGALKNRSDGERIAWPTKQPKVDLKTPAHGWTVRVAMLADLARIQLTRPQLRALIPLTTAPGGEGTDRPAPPIAAILQEPPFARGGLADRIATEIKTGFGYGFEPDKPDATPDEKNHVEIVDARKEAGHNPHLDYRALGADTALSLTLRSEGPIGLTFDNVEAPAPAFPNSMLILKPDVLFGSKPPLEEFFAGVTMRRYIDPAWTGAKGIEKGELDDKSGLDAESCWWIDFGARKIDKELPLLQYRVDGSNDLESLLAFRPRGTQHIELCASKRAIDGHTGTDWVIVAVVTTEQFGKLSVLHQQVAAARYSMSVFVRTGSAKTERGEINTPLLIAGFEWSSPKEKAVDGGDGKTDKPPSVKLEVTSARVFQTMASGPTFLRWTKTGRDFDFVHLAELANNEWKTGPVHVRELAAKLDHDTHEFLTFQRTGSLPDSKVWLCSSTFANPFPIHVHRHVGVITSRFLKELGTPAEIFCRTSAWSGRWSSAEPADAATKYQLVTPEGSLRLKDGKIFKPREEVVRVVEFETPAAILCANGPQVPQTYKQAYFDLVSTGFKFGGERGSAQLHFRFVGSPAHVAKFTEIQLNFWLNEASKEKSFRLPIKFANTPARFAVGLRLALQQAGAEDKKYHLQVLYSDRTLTEATGKIGNDFFPLVAATKTSPGFFLSIGGAKGGSGEFWSDVSLLHSPRSLEKGISPLEFGWLFSPSGEGDPIPHVAAPGLTNMVEAQARIVAVSPPIPIISH